MFPHHIFICAFTTAPVQNDLVILDHESCWSQFVKISRTSWHIKYLLALTTLKVMVVTVVMVMFVAANFVARVLTRQLNLSN
jgi:threonine/homoserine/homoserine lactone efflux protein